jgi:hypothetical protein
MNDPARMDGFEGASGLDQVIDRLKNRQWPVLLDDSVEFESFGVVHHLEFRVFPGTSPICMLVSILASGLVSGDQVSFPTCHRPLVDEPRFDE